MTVARDGELVACYLVIMCISQIMLCVSYLVDSDYLTTFGDLNTLMNMLMPILGVYALAFSIAVAGHWMDSGGLDV